MEELPGLNNATISSCYNSGEITDISEKEEAKIGGVCGQNLSESFIYSSYNIGKVNSKGYVGGAVGADFGEVSNCFYLEECLETKIENDEASKTVEEMKNNIFNSLGENFIQDTNNINNGYPVLTWQKGMMTIQ